MKDAVLGKKNDIGGVGRERCEPCRLLEAFRHVAPRVGERASHRASPDVVLTGLSVLLFPGEGDVMEDQVFSGVEDLPADREHT